MKVFITGGGGLLGGKLRKILVDYKFDVYASFYDKLIIGDNFYQMDITKKNDVFHILKKVSPDVIVHTAAYTDVDGCEKDRNTAFLINIKGTINLANVAEKLNAKFVYISTDYVFNGKKGRYTEDETTDPINYYGITKLEGEKIVSKICSNFVIARPAVIYGSEKKNFVTWVVDMLKNRKNINIVTDQYVSPTLNIDLAEQLKVLIEKDLNGVFHTSGRDRISRYDFVRCIAEVFNLNENFINPIKMKDMNWIAQRPKDSSLDISKMVKFKKPYSVKESLSLFREEGEL
jgi:dTDP-4-dehydrorhamnose reductase